uniref:S100 calcium binding protein U n=1 Tax=Hucho hucho TaxID=62062 RepID=A0A4W5MTE8_9TELE
MESAIQTIVGVFLKSAKGKESLGGNDFQKLVKSQLHNIMMDTDSSEAVKKMRQGLDANQDGKVNFEEYMNLVGYLATSLSVQCTAAVCCNNTTQHYSTCWNPTITHLFSYTHTYTQYLVLK